MRLTATRTAAVLFMALSLAVSLHLWRVSALKDELAAAEARRAALQEDYADFRYSLIRRTAETLQHNARAVDAALAEREDRHDALHAAGTLARQAIAGENASGSIQTAGPGTETNLDALLPDAVSLGLRGLHGRARAAGADAGGLSPGAAAVPVPGKAAPGASGAHDGALPGRLDRRTADLVR